MRFARIAAVAVMLFAMGATAAAAATVNVTVEPPSRGPWAGIQYRSAPGEVNRVELYTENETTVRVEDVGAIITPGVGCALVDAHTARCTTAGFQGEGLIGADVFAGDMDDTVNSHGFGLSADGGPGDDRIESSGPIAGTLNGGGGHDVLLGGPNQDTLIDGDTTGHADSDVMDGREGGATVSYASRTAPVRVDLSTHTAAGERGEADVLRNVTGATGGAGADVLRGTAGFNHLDGGAGPDRLDGGAGVDVMNGGSGNDRLAAGRGDDYLDGGPGDDRLLGGRGADTLSGGRGADLLRGGPGDDYLGAGTAACGSGFDTVFPSGEVDLLRGDCELAHFEFPTRTYDAKAIEIQPYPVLRRFDSLAFAGRCPYGDSDGVTDPLPIRGEVTLRSAGRVIGRSLITARVKARCKTRVFDGPPPAIRIRVELTGPGRRLLADGRPTEVTVAFHGRNVPPHPWKITLG